MILWEKNLTLSINDVTELGVDMIFLITILFNCGSSYGYVAYVVKQYIHLIANNIIIMIT